MKWIVPVKLLEHSPRVYHSTNGLYTIGNEAEVPKISILYSDRLKKEGNNKHIVNQFQKCESCLQVFQ